MLLTVASALASPIAQSSTGAPPGYICLAPPAVSRYNARLFRNDQSSMANITSARKRAHQAQVQRARNASLRTAVRTAIKDVTKAAAAGDKQAAQAVLARSTGILDRVSAKGVLHANARDRQKSRLARMVTAMA